MVFCSIAFMLLGPLSSCTIERGHTPPTNPPLSSMTCFRPCTNHRVIKL